VFNLAPTITIDDADTLMVTWDAEGSTMPYVSWEAGAEPPTVPDGCITIPPQETELVSALQPRLASEAQGVFWATYVNPSPEDYGEIVLTSYSDSAWETSVEIVGEGRDPEIFTDQDGQIFIAWCDAADLVAYQRMGGQSDKIPFPSCESRPGIAQDAGRNLHLVWYASEVENVYGLTSPHSLIYESILNPDGWSEPAIVAQVGNPAQPAVTTQADGNMHLAWQDINNGKGELFYASQQPYDCSDTPLSDIGQAVLNVIEQGGYHPEGYQAPYCGNRFADFIYMPNPEPAFTSQLPTDNGGFDKAAALINFVQYEALFVTMEYIASEDGFGPGTTIGDSTAELYRRIKENPSQYPKGLTIRIMLGNYPNVSKLEWGDQIWNAINDLRDAGVEEMENPEIGWKVEVANFSGVYPHSHTKFLILDGDVLLSAGYNYGWLHFSKDHPSGKGDDLVDLGMILSGPVAQAAISSYDDMWVGANQLYCADFHPEDGSDWQDSCEWKTAEGGHVPEVLKYSLKEDDQVAFSLYRTDVYKEADNAYVAALSSAKQSIDAIHVNFSLELICMVNILNPDICTIENALPWMEALLEAVEKNNVTVRAIVENSNSNGLENRVAIQVLEDELAKKGLEDLVEVRFFNGRVHTKSALVDSELVIVGSQNFHYSAFGEGGLLEYNAATDDPHAIETYQTMFDYYWEQAIPADEADWANSNK
jgi:phosphatidylserine/phosphatidylglycerophosphate/cardiolipin synthase-like enzyme